VSSDEEKDEDDEEEGESEMDQDDIDGDDEGSEEGENELVSDEEEEVKAPEPVKKQKVEMEYKVTKAPANEFLIKREATLITILKKSFKERTIIFSNEKIQCTRLMALLTIYGLKCAEVHGNLKQEDRLKAVHDF